MQWALARRHLVPDAGCLLRSLLFISVLICSRVERAWPRSLVRMRSLQFSSWLQTSTAYDEFGVHEFRLPKAMTMDDATSQRRRTLSSGWNNKDDVLPGQCSAVSDVLSRTTVQVYDIQFAH